MKSEESLDDLLYVLSCLRYVDTVWIDEIGVEELRETSAERLNVPSSLRVRSLNLKLWSQDLAAAFVRVLLRSSRARPKESEHYRSLYSNGLSASCRRCFSLSPHLLLNQQ